MPEITQLFSGGARAGIQVSLTAGPLSYTDGRMDERRGRTK